MGGKTLELRLVIGDGGQWQLQYRERSFTVDANGSFCGVTEPGLWHPVPVIRNDSFLIDEPELM